MATYKAQLMTIYPSHYPSVTFKSRAKTRNGLLRTLGREIARQVGDDAIAVHYIEECGVSPFGHKPIKRPTMAEEIDVVFPALRDELFNLRYS